MQDDFVTVCSERLPHLRALSLNFFSRFLNLVSLSDDREIHGWHEDCDRANYDRVFYGNNLKTKQLAQLAWLLASKMPQLDCVSFREDTDLVDWDYSVKRIVRDGQEVVEIWMVHQY
jgi:hypothetical protein